MSRNIWILIVISYMLSIASIAISLVRCKPVEWDMLAILASVLTLLVTILLGIIGYNYFIQKSEIESYKKELKVSIAKEFKDVRISILSSFASVRNYAAAFVIVMSMLEADNMKDDDPELSSFCEILKKCHNQLTDEDKQNSVISYYLKKEKDLLMPLRKNPAVLNLINDLNL